MTLKARAYYTIKVQYLRLTFLACLLYLNRQSLETRAQPPVATPVSFGLPLRLIPLAIGLSLLGSHCGFVLHVMTGAVLIWPKTIRNGKQL